MCLFVNCAFGSGRYTRRNNVARSATPLLLVRLGVGTRNRSRVVEVLDVVEELGTGCEGLFAFGAFVLVLESGAGFVCVHMEGWAETHGIG
jgi:hypothetical protein